jgi:hypothetical protein
MGKRDYATEGSSYRTPPPPELIVKKTIGGGNGPDYVWGLLFSTSPASLREPVEEHTTLRTDQNLRLLAISYGRCCIGFLGHVHYFPQCSLFCIGCESRSVWGRLNSPLYCSTPFFRVSKLKTFPLSHGSERGSDPFTRVVASLKSICQKEAHRSTDNPENPSRGFIYITQIFPKMMNGRCFINGPSGDLKGQSQHFWIERRVLRAEPPVQEWSFDTAACGIR